eukprot:366501-Chlamydomonas_euryale.AAC.25
MAAQAPRGAAAKLSRLRRLRGFERCTSRACKCLKRCKRLSTLSCRGGSITNRPCKTNQPFLWHCC